MRELRQSTRVTKESAGLDVGIDGDRDVEKGTRPTRLGAKASWRGNG